MHLHGCADTEVTTAGFFFFYRSGSSVSLCWLQEAARYTSRCARPPVIQMLEKDLLVELAMLDEHLVPSLPSYASAAQKLGLAQLGAGVTEALKQESVWRQLQQNKQVSIS